MTWFCLEKPCSENDRSVTLQNTCKAWRVSSFSSLTSVPSPKLSTYILVKEIPNYDQTPWHQGFKPPHLLYSRPQLFPSNLRNAFHICPFLFRPTIIIQRYLTFLLDFSDPVLLASPFISNVLRKVLLCNKDLNSQLLQLNLALRLNLTNVSGSDGSNFWIWT